MAISFVQAGAWNGSAVAFANPQTAGNTNFIIIGVTGTTTAPSPVSDSTNGAYTLIANTASSASAMVYLYAFFNIATAAAGANTISAPAASGASNLTWSGVEYSGISNTQDGTTKTGSGTGGNFSTASLTTTNANDLIIALAGGDNGHNSTVTAGTGYTQRYDHGTTVVVLDLQDQIVSATGSFTGQMNSTSGAVNWVELLVAFQSASGPVNPFLSGSVSTSGTASVQLAYEPSVAGTVAVSGSVSPTFLASPGLTGNTTVTGSVAPIFPFNQSVSGAIAVTGSVSPAQIVNQPQSGAIAVSGAVNIVFSPTNVTLSGRVGVTGSVNANLVPASPIIQTSGGPIWYLIEIIARG